MLIQFKISDIVTWLNQALTTIDNFGNFLLEKYIIPSLDLKKEFVSPIYDSNGIPIVKEDCRFEVETITVREYLRRCGITFSANQ